MDADVHNLLQDFSEALIQQNWENAHSLLTSFTRDRVTTDALAAFLDEAISEVNEEYMLPGDAWPGAVELDENPECPLASLRADPGLRALPPRMPEALTDKNYKGWYCISLLAHEDQDLAIPGWWDLWLAVADDEGDLAVAYLELAERD